MSSRNYSLALAPPPKQGDEPKIEKFSARRILSTVNNWRTDMWPLWMRERMMVGFYNAGEIPSDEPCDDPNPSLGLGNRYIKKPFDNLLDSILTDPGFIKVEDCYPLNPSRKGKVEMALDKEINGIVHHRMESTIRKLAGGAMITGRAFAFRLSRWDWKFKRGRLLHGLYDGDDVYDEEFRDWAFTGSLSLRDIDEKLAKTREYEGAGWNYKALADLKKFILGSTTAEKDGSHLIDEKTIVDMPFDQNIKNRPLDVYWYFCKNGTRSMFGQENVDLYCVSRFGQTATVDTMRDGGITYKALAVKGEEDNERILYYLPNAFESIDECLIPFIIDSRIDGEQTLAQTDGAGKLMIPRLQMMEHIALSICEGIAFATQPNWTSDGRQISQSDAKKYAQEGVSAWDFIPQGIKPMEKNNAMTGLSSALQMLQMLGMSAESDAATGDMSPIGQSQAKFKAEAQQLLQQTTANAGRRDSRFSKGLDRLSAEITKPFCRPLMMWTKGDAAYWDVRNVQINLLSIYQIQPPEYIEQRIKAGARRLAGEGDKNMVVQKCVTMLQYFGGQYSPDMHRFIAKEATRAAWGDPIAEMAIQEAPSQEERNQAKVADDQSVKALMGLPVQREPGDDPIVHVKQHFGALMQQMQFAMQQGSATPKEKAGMANLLKHAAGDVPGLPPQLQQQYGPQLEQFGAQLQKIPTSGASSEMALKERDQNRKDEALKFQQDRESNLQGDRQEKLKLSQQNLIMQIQRLVQDRSMNQTQQQVALAKLLQDGQNSAVDRAGAVMDMVQQHHEITNPQPTSEAGGGSGAPPAAFPNQPQPQPFEIPQ